MSSRDVILKRLRSATTPFEEIQTPSQKHLIQPMPDSPEAWRAIFVEQLNLLSATVHENADDETAINTILQIVKDDKLILAWDFEHIPIIGLEQALQQSGITRANPHDDTIRVGVTGVDAGLAATGSLILCADAGKPRSASLLPYVHIAIIRHSQLFPHFEAWIAHQKMNQRTFRASGNINIISGASRTADIGMELVLGAHGPADLQVILLP